LRGGREMGKKVAMTEPIINPIVKPIVNIGIKKYSLDEIFPNLRKQPITAEQLQENKIITSIGNVISLKKHIHRIFLRANKGDASSHRNLGVWYELGQHGFPIDYIQAKKHYLRAALLNDPDVTLQVQARLKAINITIERGTHTSISLFLESVKNNPQDRYTIEDMQLELSKIEKVYGKSSMMEDKVSQPYSLKDTCINFLASNVGLFKQEKLPNELKEEVLQVRNQFM